MKKILILLLLLETGFLWASPGSGPKYFVRSSAQNIQAYWKADELIVGINIMYEGKKVENVLDEEGYLKTSDPQKYGRKIHILVVKNGKANLFKLNAWQSSDDTVYPYANTVYCKMSNTRVSALLGGRFQDVTPANKDPDLWLKIINQNLGAQDWKVFYLWDEGPDEIESRESLDESCKVKLSDRVLYLHRQMKMVDPDQLYWHARYFLTGLETEDPLVFADFGGDYQQVTEAEYSQLFPPEKK